LSNVFLKNIIPGTILKKRKAIKYGIFVTVTPDFLGAPYVTVNP